MRRKAFLMAWEWACRLRRTPPFQLPLPLPNYLFAGCFFLLLHCWHQSVCCVSLFLFLFLSKSICSSSNAKSFGPDVEYVPTRFSNAAEVRICRVQDLSVSRWHFSTHESGKTTGRPNIPCGIADQNSRLHLVIVMGISISQRRKNIPNGGGTSHKGYMLWRSKIHQFPLLPLASYVRFLAACLCFIYWRQALLKPPWIQLSPMVLHEQPSPIIQGFSYMSMRNWTEKMPMISTTYGVWKGIFHASVRCKLSSIPSQLKDNYQKQGNKTLPNEPTASSLYRQLQVADKAPTVAHYLIAYRPFTLYRSQIDPKDGPTKVSIIVPQEPYPRTMVLGLSEGSWQDPDSAEQHYRRRETDYGVGGGETNSRMPKEAAVAAKLRDR